MWIETEFSVQNVPRINSSNWSEVDEGVNGVNRLATKGEKILLTTDKTRKKLPTSDKKLTEIYRQPTKVKNFK